MKRLLTLLLLACSVLGSAQDYTGFLNSNYSGITGAQLNPANIADSRLIVDVSIFGVSMNAANNYIGLKRAALAHEGSLVSAIRRAIKGDQDAFPAFKDTAFQHKYLTEIVNGKDKSLYSATRVTLPSFMITLNQKNAIGLSINARNYVNVDGISEDLARLLYSDVGRMQNYDVSGLLGKNLEAKHVSGNAMAWLEYGLTYAHVFRDKDEHFFKAGVTPKLLQGLASAYINIENLAFRFDNNNIQINNDSLQLLAVIKTHVNYGHSENLEFPAPGAPDKENNPFVNDPTFYNTLGRGIPEFTYLGFGIDLGGVYEWRPKYKSHKFNMDGKKDLWRRDENKYKLKVGLSVLDIGSIKFPKGTLSNDFTIDIDTIRYRILETGDYPVYDFDSFIDSFAVYNPSEPDYKMSLPASISAQIDYNIWKDFYVNLTPFIAFQQEKKQAKVKEVTMVSLAPRWDHKWFGAAIPVSYNAMYAKAGQPIKLGAMVRLGTFIIGTNDLSSFGSNDFFGANFYFLFKLPIPYNKVRDSDKDGISNKRDVCRNIPGTWEFKGCPDSDSDHVEDKYDKCPLTAGLKEMMGCPDKDSDGITDADDMCPDSAGTVEFKGCPDRDNDRIIDRQDVCPDEAGLAEFKGCPDKDADGTMDREDACPDIFGPKEYKGCPDKDGDKVLDKDDGCPEIAGPVENKGCPWPDTDKDGVFDREDSCVTLPGIALYKGCPPPPPPPPPMKAAEKKIIERAFASLEFATGKDIIEPKSFPSLNALAGLLKQHEADWKLKLEGHTDNQGDPDRNMVLSEKRSKAVKNYLMKKGVKDDQVIAEWYGQDRPIADNKTPAGRQKNRRVEMKIVSKE